MDPDIKAASNGKRALTQAVASRSSDPDFYSALEILPNPDTVLRKLGRTQEVYDAILSDAHVMGEMRSIRAGLIRFEFRLQAGGDTPADMRALELCEQVLANRPAPGMQWIDVFWNMGQAVFRGYQAHEVVWQRQGGLVLPWKVLDRPQRRFVFNQDNELRLRTRSAPVAGEDLGPYKWLITRHMPSYINPYGVALLSSCFWPHTFKTGGLRYFVKFCERYGLPWPVGKYPDGASEDQQRDLLEGLTQMVEDAVAVIPQGNDVDLLSTSTGMAQLPQERLINTCNSEMSKALTSQTLATEIQGNGSRAASETHRGREESVNDSDRIIIIDAMNELMRWVTEINVPNATPPWFEFYEEEEARKEWVEVFDVARQFISIPARFAHERLQIPLPQQGEAVLPMGTVTGNPGPGLPDAGTQFSRGGCPHCSADHAAPVDDPIDRLTEQAARGADAYIEDMIDQVREMAFNAASMEDLEAEIARRWPEISATRLGEMTSLAMQTGALQGMDSA